MVVTISSKSLSWDSKRRTLAGEMSTVNGSKLGPPPAITVDSHRTGKTVLFRLVCVERNTRENEIEAFVYQPTEYCGVDKLVILND